jgi:hypothetical protein
MENKEESSTIINKEINQENNDYTLTKKFGWFVGTYFIGFSLMVFLYGLFKFIISPSLKYMNIMLSAIVFYYFGFFELAILLVSLGLFYLNNNYDLIKNKITKISFFYNSLKQVNDINKIDDPEFELVHNIINQINKYETILNKYIEYLKQFKFGDYKIISFIYKITFFNKYVNKLENLLNKAYQKLLNINQNTINKIKTSKYVTNKIEPVINIINDVVQDKKDIESQDEYINTKETLNNIKNDIDDINNSLLDDNHIHTDDEINNNFKNMEQELNNIEDIMKEFIKLDSESDFENKGDLTEEDITKSLNLLNLFGKMMKITELPAEDKQKCKDKIKTDIMDTMDFRKLYENSFC